MKPLTLILLSSLLNLFSFEIAGAQSPGYHYTPQIPNPPIHIPNSPTYVYRPGDWKTVSMKHHFTISFTDGHDTTIYTQLVVDSPVCYLTMENKAVRKKDSGRIIKIYPSGTKTIAHVDPTTGHDYVGQSADSCWLFRVISGKMNAYTPLAEISVPDDFIRYIQVGDGPLIAVTDPEAMRQFADDKRALELFDKKAYNRAIKRYNRTGN